MSKSTTSSSRRRTSARPALRREPPSCAELLRVLADETRLKVVELLMDGPRRVFELNLDLDIEPSLLSHHMRALRDAGVVEVERDGKTRIYSLSPSVSVPRTRAHALDLGCCKIEFA